MEKLEKKKKYFLIISIVFILVIITICSTAYARYVINKKAQLNISTLPFYFEAEAQSSIKFDNEATTTLTVKNNDGIKFNSEPVTYDISIVDNNKFSFSIDSQMAENNLITKTLAGGSLLDESLNIRFIADANQLNPNETVTLKVASNKPYAKTEEIPINISLKEITVTLVANGGTVNPTTVKVYKGKTYSSLPTPTWAGHTFNGWFTAATGGNQVVPSTQVAITTTTQTLYAQWTSRLLADKVSIGDYVNYPVSYSNVATNADGEYIPKTTYTGWRVLSIEGSGDDKYVRLVTAGVPMTYVHPATSNSGTTSVTALTTNFFSTAINSTSTNYKFRKCGFVNSSGTTITTISALKTLFTNNYTKTSSNTPVVQAMTKSDLDAVWGSTTDNGEYVTSNDLLAIPSQTSGSYAAYHLATYNTYNSLQYLWNVRYAGGVIFTNSEHGVRPVVTLKAEVETTGKSGSVWQLTPM